MPLPPGGKNIANVGSVLNSALCGKQVNSSENYLKLFKISRLCDGVGDCHAASDELQEHLRCSGMHRWIMDRFRTFGIISIVQYMVGHLVG